MTFLNESLFDQAQMIPTRDAFGKGTIAAAENHDVIVLTADVSGSVRANWFTKEYPYRFIDMGIAEQNMVAVAAGIAAAGKIPFASTFGVFLTGRVWDQVRVLLGYSQSNVKLVATHTGITVGEDGATHQALEDIGLMRILPNMTVIVPADYNEAFQAVKAAAEWEGPVYIRLGRASVPVIFNENYQFSIGKSQILQPGSDVTIVACGAMIYEALKASRLLQTENISAQVINLSTIKPLDTETLIQAASETGAFVTAEEHQVAGGMGSAVAECMATRFPIPIEMIGIHDTFGQSGDADDLLDYYQLRAVNIADAARRVIKRK